MNTRSRLARPFESRRHPRVPAPLAGRVPADCPFSNGYNTWQAHPLVMVNTCPREPSMPAGTLFLVSTPIGNLEDITLRALRVLREVAVIAAEDTRRTSKLLSHFDIHTPTTSFYEHKELEKLPRLLARLAAGERVALVSDAGTPGRIRSRLSAGQGRPRRRGPRRSGPGRQRGSRRARRLRAARPAPSRSSGSRPPGARRATGGWHRSPTGRETLVFFEAPHRVRETLAAGATDLRRSARSRRPRADEGPRRIRARTGFGQCSHGWPHRAASSHSSVGRGRRRRRRPEPCRDGHDCYDEFYQLTENEGSQPARGRHPPGHPLRPAFERDLRGDRRRPNPRWIDHDHRLPRRQRTRLSTLCNRAA